jgi:UDP-N-acetylglucosamine 4,6-dehydratase
MRGGELFVPKIPSMKVVDLACAMAPEARLEIVGIRPGEKLHEEMISGPDSRRALDMGDYYLIQPEMDWWHPGELAGAPVADGFSYASNTNERWLSVDDLRSMIATAK